MKIYTFPKVSYKLVKVDSIQNYNTQEALFTTITNKKREIDKVQHKWDSAKKISNEYEYIYTSSNPRKNISSVLPVSRSFFKLREIIYDFKLDIGRSCSCIAEAPGGFMQSLLQYSDESDIILDSIYGITLVSDDKDVPYWNPLLFNNDIIELRKA